MEITRITKENIEYFLPLLPEGMDFSRYSLLGLIGDDDEAVAAMALSGTSAMVEIEWLYVDHEKRRRGVASLFLQLLAEAFQDEVEAICVSYPPDLDGADEFFYSNGFFQTEGDAVWLITVKDALELPEIKKIKKLKERQDIKAYTLDKLSGGLGRLFKQFVREETGDTLLLDSCDPAVSIGIIDTEKMEFNSCILVDRLAESRYQISLLLNRGNGILVAYLIYAFLELCEKKDLSDITLQFAAVNEHVERFAQTLLGDNEDFLKGRLTYSVRSLR
ncbi:MAG: GNAT family N-acetyltransferase [Lachnospiraceae bacterium]|nr:GNAT family N-acetyltransferase [Lachnospiraceae bacterium]